ncbi:MAG: chromosome condensation protein CrcB, partial [Cyanobacteriota bacterium]|nr:chromosome condensation protein CrcB [Cyanobacteriota bacterium]
AVELLNELRAGHVLAAAGLAMISIVAGVLAAATGYGLGAYG